MKTQVAQTILEQFVQIVPLLPAKQAEERQKSSGNLFV